MHSLARNHALVDGNKRLAWAATRVFCLLNARDIEFTVDDVEALVLAVAIGASTCRRSPPRSSGTSAEVAYPGSATTASISTCAPFGSAATPIATRAGGSASKNVP